MGALEGRVAVITGAGRGIGREHALLFAKEGASVVVNDLGGSNAGEGADTGPAQEVAAEITAAGGSAVWNTENIATWDGAKNLVQQAIDDFGRLDVVVNNAGILRDAFIASMDEAQWDAVIGVHLKGHFAVLRHAAEYWKAQSKAGNQPIAAVINTASGSGVTLPNAGQANYGSAKAGIAALTLIAAEELDRYGVRVNAIAPIARTRLTLATPGMGALMGEPEEGEVDLFSPENISPLVAYLATEKCPVTGKVFAVQGGAISALQGWHDTDTIETDGLWTIDDIAERLPQLMFEWSDTDIIMRDTVREFIAKEIRPHLDELESGELSPYPIARKLFSEFGLDVLAAEAVKGMLEKERAKQDATAHAELQEKSGGLGGLGAQASMAVAMVAELAGVSIGLLSTVGVSLGLGAATIMSRGTLAQKERWLPELMTLEKIAAWAITEPDAGSDAFGGMKTYVKRDGADYLLNGQKTFITNGPNADVLIVYAKLDEGDTNKRDRQVLTFVLDSGMPGLTQGKPFKKMGMMSSPTGELFFDNVRLTPDRLLGETEQHAGGDGRDSARANFVAERLGIAAMSLGIINECHRLCVDYAKTRTLWGKEIGQFQLIQLKLAKMEVARINVQNMVFQTLEKVTAGKLPSLGEASAIKWYSSETATEVAMDAVQLFGGNGYMTEYRVEQLARDAKSLMIYAGSNEVQITHVAKSLLA